MCLKVKYVSMESSEDVTTVIVRINNGPIKGNKRISFMGDTFYSFRSIPYAKPPLGELRFRAPKPPDDWKDILDATKPPVHAPFFDNTETEKFVTSEDCLVLNVYTKSLNPNVPQPVMVWIHGGAFRVGSSQEHMYGPDFLLRKDVVVVTINYRLGALGFLSIDDPTLDIPGNAGLKDQSMALRWVRNNISVFGGDDKNVTAFGNSAGAVSLNLHMLSPHSKGLFDKAIIQSGSALADWANFPKNDWTRRLAIALGWSGKTDRELYEFLLQANANDLIEHQDTILTESEKSYLIFSFGPAVEAYESDTTFFTKAPKFLVQDAWSVNVPLIIGCNSDEMLMMLISFKKNASYLQSVSGFELLIPFHFGLERGSPKSIKIAKEIQSYYYGDNEVTDQYYEPTMQAWSDRYFWYPMKMSIKARVKDTITMAPTFLYRFSVDSRIFNWKKLQFAGEDVPGSSHADDIHYLFKCAYLKERLPDDSIEMLAVEKMVSLWTSFAVTGKPHCADLESEVWPPVKDTDHPMPCLLINSKLNIAKLPETDRINFWTKLHLTDP